MTRAWLFIAALPIVGCAGGADPWLEPADLDVAVQRSGFAQLGGIGLSGSALDGHGLELGRFRAARARCRAPLRNHANLDSRFEQMPNVEGIVREGNRIVLLTDHDSLQQAGATESIRIGPFETDAEPGEMDEDDD